LPHQVVPSFSQAKELITFIIYVVPASKHPQIRWIDLRENLQETIGFPIVYGGSCKISLKPIH